MSRLEVRMDGGLWAQLLEKQFNTTRKRLYAEWGVDMAQHFEVVVKKYGIDIDEGFNDAPNPQIASTEHKAAGFPILVAEGKGCDATAAFYTVGGQAGTAQTVTLGASKTGTNVVALGSDELISREIVGRHWDATLNGSSGPRWIEIGYQHRMTAFANSVARHALGVYGDKAPAPASSPKTPMPAYAKAAGEAYEATRDPVRDVPWESLDPLVRTVATNAVRYAAEKFSVADRQCKEVRDGYANTEKFRKLACDAADEAGRLRDELQAAHALLGEADMKMRLQERLTRKAGKR